MRSTSNSRRDFLKLAGAGVTSAMFSPLQAQRVPDPPGKKLGWAIVGLGNLSINQILPAFGKCEKSKVAGSPWVVKSYRIAGHLSAGESTVLARTVQYECRSPVL